ncbi:hypothetical protein BDZ94DRAFT_1243627 [Collybia nuda]|uniref:Uncharacterized protein n=1 Tax=Collybia nuda TaxID=64659 RepID=A0A9P5YHE2_9AGAR|nr:hypothetical protein BDZ94DRAFT_1243627 [Collybia nuda]
MAPDPRFAALAEQNLLLRRRVESLESLVETFRREMIAVKGALGPWFKMGSNGRGHYHSYYSGEIAGGVRDFTVSTSGGRVEGAGEATPPPWGDFLAPYFPSEEEEHPVQRGQQHRGGHEGVYGIGPPPPPPPPPLPPLHTYTIAPLDLSTNLEGTLGGLRESVVGLAAGVDSMGRRQEIALTNETMRLGEEVGGLRAGMHGLRMQVHTMMMDRNAQVTGRDEGWAAGRMYTGSITKL